MYVVFYVVLRLAKVRVGKMTLINKRAFIKNTVVETITTTSSPHTRKEKIEISLP